MLQEKYFMCMYALILVTCVVSTYVTCRINTSDGYMLYKEFLSWGSMESQDFVRFIDNGSTCVNADLACKSFTYISLT